MWGIRQNDRAGFFPEFSDRDPIFFWNLQLRDRTFLKILSSRVVLFPESRVRNPLFFKILSSWIDLFSVWTWNPDRFRQKIMRITRGPCRTGAGLFFKFFAANPHIFRNSQLGTWTFFKILSCWVTYFPESLDRDLNFFREWGLSPPYPHKRGGRGIANVILSGFSQKYARITVRFHMKRIRPIISPCWQK